jgi:hypothetical protein
MRPGMQPEIRLTPIDLPENKIVSSVQEAAR